MSIQSLGLDCHSRRDQLDVAGQRTYDSLADPEGRTIRGLRGPGGIILHSPELSRRARPLNRYLRHEAGLGGRVRELAILTTARELDSQFEWAAHEPDVQRRLSPVGVDMLDIGNGGFLDFHGAAENHFQPTC